MNFKIIFSGRKLINKDEGKHMKKILYKYNWGMNMLRNLIFNRHSLLNYTGNNRENYYGKL